ncbi:MAG: transposase [Deinococcus sp.]|nr:transposase [Deinococcus sp.]
MLSTLDPLGLPLATEVLPGQRADDQLSLPAITRVREQLGQRGLLYVGDGKMAALETRAFVHPGGDYYWCPLPERQLCPDQLAGYLAPVWAGVQAVTPITRERADGQLERIADGYERLEQRQAIVAGHSVTWMERRLVVRSLQWAHREAATVRKRVTKVQTKLETLTVRRRGKRRFRSVAALRRVVAALLARERVQGLLQVSYQDCRPGRPVRGYGERPARVRQERTVEIRVAIDEAAMAAVERRLGWRVYATNLSAAQLSLQQAVLAYRHQYLIERSFGRLKGRPLSLTPMYLQRDDHATGLIRLLTIGLQVLTLLEFAARRRLATTGTTLAGLYTGNPTRETAQPTGERLLAAFREITLTIWQDPHQTRRHVTPLSPLQRHILALLALSTAIYTKLCTDSAKPP